MSKAGDDNDFFKLYAVIGHYICYIKDFSGKWYRVNDDQVVIVDIDEVLSQEAYVLLYCRTTARLTSLYPLEDSVATDDRFLVSDIEEEAETCKGTAFESLLGSYGEDSVATNGEMQNDASASASGSSSSEILFNMELDNSTLFPEKAKCEKESSSHGVHDVILKTDGGISSEKKVKPLCFSGKRPRDKCASRKSEGKFVRIALFVI